MAHDFPWRSQESTNPIDKKMPFKNVDMFNLDSLMPFEDENQNAQNDLNVLNQNMQSIDIDSKNIESINEKIHENVVPLKQNNENENIAENENTKEDENLKEIESKNIHESALQNDVKNEEIFKNINKSQDSNINIVAKHGHLHINKAATSIALKYRPVFFNQLVGQENIAQTLSLALDSQKISNAYLFSGLRGSGKTSSARILARCLQCNVKISSQPCNVCDNCHAAMNNNHLDIIELDAASNRGIDDIRNIIEQTRYNPTLGRFKIFIIDEVHMLTNQAFNALLKTLEEPPEFVKFILATTEALKIPATILSRVQHFRFKKIQNIALKDHIKDILEIENARFEEDALDLLIRAADGSMRDSLTLLEQGIIYSENNLSLEKISQMLGALNPSIFDELFLHLREKNKDKCLAFVKDISQYNAENVINELIIYIKNKTLQDEPCININLAMQYANILSNAKNMLNSDFDEGFIILLTILKMLDVQYEKLPKINEVPNVNLNTNQNAHQYANAKINQAQNNSLLNVQSMQSAQNNGTNISPIMQKDSKESIVPNAMSKNENTQSNAQIDYMQDYKRFVEKLYERDFRLGEIFEKNIVFKTYEKPFVELDFYTSDEDTQTLRSCYGAIMQVMKEIYGDDVKMKVDKKKPGERNKNFENAESKNINNAENDKQEIGRQISDIQNSNLQKITQNILEKVPNNMQNNSAQNNAIENASDKIHLQNTQNQDFRQDFNGDVSNDVKNQDLKNIESNNAQKSAVKENFENFKNNNKEMLRLIGAELGISKVNFDAKK